MGKIAFDNFALMSGDKLRRGGKKKGCGENEFPPRLSAKSPVKKLRKKRRLAAAYQKQKPKTENKIDKAFARPTLPTSKRLIPLKARKSKG